MVIFHSFLYVYQRVYPRISMARIMGTYTHYPTMISLEKGAPKTDGPRPEDHPRPAHGKSWLGTSFMAARMAGRMALWKCFGDGLVIIIVWLWDLWDLCKLTVRYGKSPSLSSVNQRFLNDQFSSSLCNKWPEGIWDILRFYKWLCNKLPEADYRLKTPRVFTVFSHKPGNVQSLSDWDELCQSLFGITGI